MASALRLRPLAGPRPVVRFVTAHVGVEAARGLDEARRRARMEAEWVPHGQRDRSTSIVLDRGLGSRGLAGAEVRRLGPQGAAGFGGHVREGRAELGGDGCRHGALDERSLGEHDALAPLRRQQVQRHLGAQHGASEVHQHDHPVALVCPLDRLQHSSGVGAERRLGSFDAPGELDRHLGAHAAGQLGDALRERRAVRDDDEPDHRCYPAAGGQSSPYAR